MNKERLWEYKSRINKYVNPYYLIPILFIPFLLTTAGILLPQSSNSQDNHLTKNILISKSFANSNINNPNSSSSTNVKLIDSSNLPIPNNPAQSIWYPVALTNSFMSSYYLPPSQTTTFFGNVENYSYNITQNVLISASFVDKNNVPVALKTWNNVTLSPFQSRLIQLTSPANLNPGIYYVNVGIYTSNGSNLLGWFTHYQNFTVGK